MRVAFFVFNTGNGDRRVDRQASLLARHGYEVRIYCFLEPGLPATERRNGYTLIRMDQRGAVTRFFDDRVLRRFKRPRQHVDSEAVRVTAPQDHAPVRPCPEPTPRVLEPRASASDREYWAYLRQINLTWARAATAWKPDIVQAHDCDALEAATLTADACGARFVYDSHELWSDQPFIQSQEAVDYWNAVEAKGVQRADAVMTVSRPFAKVMEQRYGKPVLPLHNCQAFSEVMTRPKLSQRFGRPVALYQGVYGLDRGLEELIASARHQDSVVIALRGYGQREPELRELAKPYEHVIFLDPCPSNEIVSYATEGSFGVIPFLPSCLNHYWNTPNKLFEFMLAGLPIAAADLPDLRNFIEGERVGVLFDPYSLSDIARALVELSQNPNLAEMGSRAHHACRERWNWEQEGKKLLELYANLAASVATGNAAAPGG